MGFRSNFITEDMAGIEVPDWFKEKYPTYAYKEKGTLAFAQLWESKWYEILNEDERLLDIQKIVKDAEMRSLVLILLHECGGITRVEISPTSIKANEPTEWEEVESVEHDYCYGFSDINKQK